MGRYWMFKSQKDKFTILDDSCGMNKNEFLEKWVSIEYNRKSKDCIKNRWQIIRKNSCGHLGLFCFCDKYIFSTSKDEELSSFE